MKFIFLLFPLILIGQKKTQYYNAIDEEVTSKEFVKLIDNRINLSINLESDSTLIYKIIKRTEIGELSISEHESLKSYLKQNYNQVVGSNQFIIINYITSYPKIKKTDESSRLTVLSKKYPKKLYELVDCKIFWIHDSTQTNMKRYKRKHINWLLEKNGFIKRLFYPYIFNYGNATIVSPNGKYYNYFGEFGPDNVYDGLRELFKL